MKEEAAITDYHYEIEYTDGKKIYVMTSASDVIDDSQSNIIYGDNLEFLISKNENGDLFTYSSNSRKFGSRWIKVGSASEKEIRLFELCIDYAYSKSDCATWEKSIQSGDLDIVDKNNYQRYINNEVDKRMSIVSEIKKILC